MADPTVAQVRMLEPLAMFEISDADTDANGHLNIVRYMQLHNDGGWAFFATLGLGEQQARDGSAGSFDVEHHIRYLREVHIGDLVSYHPRLLERSDKALRHVGFLVNNTTHTVANAMEVVSLSMDMATRRVAPWPEPVRTVLDTRLAQFAALPWPYAGNAAMVLSRG